VFIGIEAGNEYDLKVYNKKAVMEDNYKILSLMKEAGIYCSDFGFIMFNPYSTIENINKNFNFLLQNESCHFSKYISDIKITINTAIYKRVKNDNLMFDNEKYGFLNDDVYELHKFIQNVINPSDILKNELYFNEFCELYYMVKDFMELENIDLRFTDILNNLFCLIKEFFTFLYLKNDLTKCRNDFSAFKGKMNSEYKRCQMLLYELRKKYMKFLVKNSSL
jgi:hypothetical protein